MKRRKTNFIMLMLSSVICFTVLNKADAQTSIKIGNQEWTSGNLNVATFKNGDTIPEAKTEEAWVEAGIAGKPAWCYYDNDLTNADNYGKLYNWYAATDPRGLAPSGWHIPSDKEWTKLIDYLGGEEDAGDKMKSNDGWDMDENGNNGGSNESGFSGLPGGMRLDDSEGSFYYTYGGSTGQWWSSTGYDKDNSLSFALNITRINYIDVYSEVSVKNCGLSVRCLRD